MAQRGGNIVVNELATQRLGFKNPADAVGKTLKAALVDNEIGLVPVTIIGVVKDSRFRSVKLPLDPIMFSNWNQGHTHLIVRYNGDPTAVRAGIERMWKGITTDVPFNAEYSADVIGELSAAEAARAQTFAAVALLPGMVSHLGRTCLAPVPPRPRT